MKRLTLKSSDKYCFIRSNWEGLIVSRNASRKHQTSRKPAIPVEPQLRRWMSFISNILRGSWSISLLLGLWEKYFSNIFRFSYSPLASIWLIIFDVHRRWIVPYDMWELHLVNCDFIPNSSFKSRDALRLTLQLSPHAEDGTNDDLISRFIIAKLIDFKEAILKSRFWHYINDIGGCILLLGQCYIFQIYIF